MTNTPPGDVVTSLPYSVSVSIPGTERVYILAAPTFDQAGAIGAVEAGEAPLNNAVFNEGLRKAVAKAPGLEDSARKEMKAAIDAAEAAEDVLGSLFTAHGNDPSAWNEEAKAEMKAAHIAVRETGRALSIVEWEMREAPDVVALRSRQYEMRRREQRVVVGLCIGSSPKDVGALPAGDVTTLYERALNLIRPSPSAEKN